MKKQQITIGLTGHAGCGKSFVSQLLQEEWGIPVIDSDAAAKALYQPGSPVLGEIAERFGQEFLLPDGTLDRAKLAGLVFGDETALRALERITHPATLNSIKASIAALHEAGHNVVFVESAIAKECSFEQFCDEIWLVYASEETRWERVSQSRGYTRERFLGLKNNQTPLSDLWNYADCVIVNENHANREQILRQIRFFFSRIPCIREENMLH